MDSSPPMLFDSRVWPVCGSTAPGVPTPIASTSARRSPATHRTTSAIWRATASPPAGSVTTSYSNSSAKSGPRDQAARTLVPPTSTPTTCMARPPTSRARAVSVQGILMRRRDCWTPGIGAGRAVSPMRASSTRRRRRGPRRWPTRSGSGPGPCRRRRRRRRRWWRTSSSRATLPRSVEVDAELARAGPRCSGPTKPMASSTSSASSSKSVPSTFSNRPSTSSTSWALQRPHAAVVVAEERLGVDARDALAALLVGRGDLVDHRLGRPRVRCRAARRAAGA